MKHVKVASICALLASLNLHAESGRNAWLRNAHLNEATARPYVASAADHLPTRKLDASSSSRRFVAGIALRPGDELRIEGMPHGREAAAVDYIEIHPEGRLP